MKTFLIFGAVGLAVLAGPSAGADLVSFPNIACSLNVDGSGAFTGCIDYGYINQNYGDTAQVIITYIDKITSNSLRWWDTNYNTLRGVAWGGIGDGAGSSWNRIEIQPLGNSVVTLNSFQMEAYSNTQRNTNIQILDLQNNVPAELWIANHWHQQPAQHFFTGLKFRQWYCHRMERQRL